MKKYNFTESSSSSPSQLAGPSSLSSQLAGSSSPSQLTDPSPLSQLSDEVLLSGLHALVRKERRCLIQILEHLLELDHRGSVLRRGFASLHEYCVEKLHYSDGAAYRRLKAMRLMRTLPVEVSSGIESGALNLTTLSMAQRAFEEVKLKDACEMRKLLQGFQHCTKREAEVLAFSIAPSLKPKSIERTEALSLEETKVSFVMDQELKGLIDRINTLTTRKDASYLELFKFMARKTLEKIDPKPRAQRKPAPRARTTAPEDIQMNHPRVKQDERSLEKVRAGQASQDEDEADSNPTSARKFNFKPASPEKSHLKSASPEKSHLNSASPEKSHLNSASPEKSELNPVSPEKLPVRLQIHEDHPDYLPELPPVPEYFLTPSSRYIKSSERRHVREQSQMRCSFVDPATGRRCSCTRALQIDHLQPYALAGSNRRENLRLLCPAHNRLVSTEERRTSNSNAYAPRRDL